MTPQECSSGQSDLLQKVLLALSSGLMGSVTLVGPKGSGKTAFVLGELLPAARERGWCPIYVPLEARASDPELAIVDAADAVARSASGEAGTSGSALPSGSDAVALHAGGADAFSKEDFGQLLNAALSRVLRSWPVVLLVLDDLDRLANETRSDSIAALRSVLGYHAGRVVACYTMESSSAFGFLFRDIRQPLYGSTYAIPIGGGAGGA